MNKYEAEYLSCNKCGFIQAADPFWLREAYESPINIEDTGLLKRNILFAKRTTGLLFFLFNRSGSFLDYAGGNGLFVRLMRDNGFDFYWMDPFTENIFARGFEYKNQKTIELTTTFESFEHFTDPIAEISKMLSHSRNILLSTELYKGDAPDKDKWDYYSFSHGQHISFYSDRTLKYIADKFKLNLCSNGKSFHLLTEKEISPSVFNILLKLSLFGFSNIISHFQKSKTSNDSIIASKIRTGSK